MTRVVVAEGTHEMVVMIVVVVVVSAARQHSKRRQGDGNACCDSDGAGLSHSKSTYPLHHDNATRGCQAMKHSTDEQMPISTIP